MKLHQRIATALAGLLLSGTVAAEVLHIDNAQLQALMAKGVPVVDIRTEPEWKQTGIVPGSHLLTFFDERGNADPASWLKKLTPIAKPADPVIVICRSGNRTQAVSNFLSQQAGYKTVYNVRQGINVYLRDRLPVADATPVLAKCQSEKRC